MSGTRRRVAGHGLQREGKAFELMPNGWELVFGRDGHGLCSCGAVSPFLHADSARRNWHREHKGDVENQANR